MSDSLTSVYEASDLSEAELLHQRLIDSGVDAVVDATASPLDGLTAANQGTHVMVREEDLDEARAVVDAFLAEQGER